MPSSQKTEFLNLNQWNDAPGGDKPKYADHNDDNRKIDAFAKDIDIRTPIIMTQSEYDALPDKGDNTYIVIPDEGG